MDTWHETTGSLSNSASKIPAMNRDALIVANNSDTVMILRIGKVATATAGIPIQPNDSIAWEGDSTPQEDVWIFCSGTSKPFTAYEFGYRPTA